MGLGSIVSLSSEQGWTQAGTCPGQWLHCWIQNHLFFGMTVKLEWFDWEEQPSLNPSEVLFLNFSANHSWSIMSTKSEHKGVDLTPGSLISDFVIESCNRRISWTLLWREEQNCQLITTCWWAGSNSWPLVIERLWNVHFLNYILKSGIWKDEKSQSDSVPSQRLWTLKHIIWWRVVY